MGLSNGEVATVLWRHGRESGSKMVDLRRIESREGTSGWRWIGMQPLNDILLLNEFK